MAALASPDLVDAAEEQEVLAAAEAYVLGYRQEGGERRFRRLANAVKRRFRRRRALERQVERAAEAAALKAALQRAASERKAA